MKRFFRIAKGIINYIGAMFFATIFALFLDANIGWFILLSLLLAPLLSVFLAWLSSRLITVTCQMKESILSKGDSCQMTIHITNRSIFPTPPIELTLTKAPGVCSMEPYILASVMSRATQSFPISFTAQICGKSTIGIEQIRVTDYLGLFSFPIRKADTTTLQVSVAVIPDIAEISARDDNLLKTMQASLHTEDSDDTTESITTSFGGFPGYNSREYVPGDPLKRINWKQSAKKNKLLVRLDDEMASQTINVVLDSVFQPERLNTRELLMFAQYSDCTPDNVLYHVAEDAIQNALGILQVLLRHNYTIHFYVYTGKEFTRYEIPDEIALENVRLDLAHYSFVEEDVVPRFPIEELAGTGSAVSLFSTPNSYADAYATLSTHSENVYTTIYSVVEEGKKRLISDEDILLVTHRKEKDKPFATKVKNTLTQLAVPFLLAFLLSANVFYAFDVPLLSWWTIAQFIVCVAVFALCEFVKKHRFVGGAFISILIVGILYMYIRIVFLVDWGTTYMHWFMSGGDSVPTTLTYLLSILLVFTTFFAMVVYYFTQALYRTSFLMLVSLIPFIVHVKLMHEMNMTYAVFTTALNIGAFLMHHRTAKDKGKRIVGNFSGLASVGLYTLLFLLIGLAVPKNEDTRYYYVFENLFLGGNVSTILPDEYSAMSEHSGNADNFDELNDRKLYEISSVELGPLLYLNRQTFDYYDFEHDYWYADDYSSLARLYPETWQQRRAALNPAALLQALRVGEELSPGFLDKYGLENFPNDFMVQQDTISITTTNFPSVAYLTPPGTFDISITFDNNRQDMDYTKVSKTGIYQCIDGFLFKDLEYEVTYYDVQTNAAKVIAAGGANLSVNQSVVMLDELLEILAAHKDTDYYSAAFYYLKDALEALEYERLYSVNAEKIPDSVHKLALEITEGCTYDWEKASALQKYFEENDFVYDLSYDAPDDSVEYFLFDGKTGTCSDYASAYVLMARSVGLITRYAEGFVPEEEYGGQYVVRTDCGHAYPEVYIPNVGFVVYEATKPAIYNVTAPRQGGNGFAGYLMVVGYRSLLIFTVVSAAIVLLLFIRLILGPFVSEAYFASLVKKASPAKAILLIYWRIRKKLTDKTIENAFTLTPAEYGERFHNLYDYSIREFIDLVEAAAYTDTEITELQKEKAQKLYPEIRTVVRNKKR